MRRTRSWVEMWVVGVVVEMRGLLSARSPHMMHEYYRHRIEVVAGLDNPLLQF